MTTEPASSTSDGASRALVLHSVVELLVEALQVHFGQHIIIELPDPNLAYLRLARKARELAQPYPAVLAPLEAYLKTFPSLYGIGDWLDMWPEVWEGHGEVYQLIAELRNAALMLVVDTEGASEAALTPVDEELLKKSSEVIETHRKLKAREWARILESAGLRPTAESSQPEKAPSQEANASPHTDLSPVQRAFVLEHLINRMLAIVSIHFSGFLLVENERANRLYLLLRRWAEEIAESHKPLQIALMNFLDVYPNLYEAGDDVDWEYSDWCVAPLKARLSEALVEVGPPPDTGMPNDWTMVFNSADETIEAFKRLKREEDIQFTKRARAGAARQAARDRGSLGTAVKPPGGLTPEQESEFDRYQYKSRLPIAISGIVPSRQANLVKIGTVELSLSDALFSLLLRLVVALKEDPQGYVFKGDRRFGRGLVAEGLLNADGIDQRIGSLRQAVGPALKGLSAKDFIEGRRAKHIRLSTHPALVSIDSRLLDHPDETIRGLAGKLLGKSSQMEVKAAKPVQAAE